MPLLRDKLIEVYYYKPCNLNQSIQQSFLCYLWVSYPVGNLMGQKPAQELL